MSMQYSTLRFVAVCVIVLLTDVVGEANGGRIPKRTASIDSLLQSLDNKQVQFEGLMDRLEEQLNIGINRTTDNSPDHAMRPRSSRHDIRDLLNSLAEKQDQFEDLLWRLELLLDSDEIQDMSQNMTSSFLNGTSGLMPANLTEAEVRSTGEHDPVTKTMVTMVIFISLIVYAMVIKGILFCKELQKH
ncbi:Hypp2209 [Branchiostoma lanceolatum]|uniref:Hypp2209 protein n=1 Tax=Branchiostoma lanceolatum TaxID=7740 RepID=A0A8J9ZQW1_BRALA|nr:Hypp2209 [Branchiostoma lanceolatum]